MKIAFFTDMFLPQVNGVANAVVQQAKQLADRGHRIYIIAPRFPQQEEFTYTNIAVKRCASVPALFYPNLKLTTPFDPNVLKLIKDEGVELIHLHTPGTLGIQAILAAKLLRLPLVGTFHGFFMDRQYLRHLKLDFGLIEGLIWQYSKLFYDRCGIVACHSENVRAELLKRSYRRPIKVIPLGIDPGMFDNTKAKAVKQTHNRHGKLLLFVGRIAHEKNIPYLLECLAPVFRSVPSAKLLIVGDGPQMPDVKAKTSELGISDKVILTGMIEYEKLAKSGIFGACDVFVNASNTETGPLTVLEAQANGLVCVSVKGKGMNLIKDGINGYEVDSNDKKAFAKATINLLTNKRAYERMRKATLQEVKRYDYARIAGQWERLYCTVQKKRMQRNPIFKLHKG